MFNSDLFVFTTKRKEPEGSLNTEYLVSLVLLGLVAITAFYLAPEQRLRFSPVLGYVYEYPSPAERIVAAFAKSFLEIVFFLLIPFTLRFALKPRVSASRVESLRVEYQRIDRILKKDIILLMQIRMLILVMLMIYGVVLGFSSAGALPINTRVVINYSNIATAYLIVVFLIPRSLDKLVLERRIQNAPEPELRRQDDISRSFWNNLFVYGISWVLVYVFVRIVVFQPLGI